MSANINTATTSATTTGAARFPLGQTFITPAAQEAIRDAGQLPLEFLLRHQSADWGDVCEDDRRENELSLAQGFRLLSSYRTKEGQKLWVITEADRSSTCILLPSEY